MGEILGRRELNRALLERQALLPRVDAGVAEMLEHLVGLQAQAPLPPYLALWSRIEGFDPHELGRMLLDRQAVRMTLMRGTVHLVTVRDALRLRPLLQVVIERTHGGAFGRRMGGAEPREIEAAVRELLADGPMTARELAKQLVARGIGEDVEAVASAARAHAPLLQVPPRGVWGAGGQARFATLEDWPGRSLEAEPSLDELVLRYLRAFGPASVMDVQNWSGLTKLTEVVERLRHRLVTFRDEDGRELFDLPDAPAPTRRRRPRCASWASTTTSCSGTPTAGASSRRASPGTRCRPTAASSTTCSSTACCARPGGSSARASAARRSPSARSASSRRPSATRWPEEARRVVDFVAADASERDVRFEPAAG